MSKFQNMQNQDNDEDDMAWIFSYADMISLVLGFFVIMFSMSTLDEKKLEEFSKKIKESLVNKEKIEEEEEVAEAVVGMENETRQLRALQLLVSVLNIGQNMDDAVKKIEQVTKAARDAQAAKEQLTENMKKEQGEAISTFLMRGNKKKDVVIEIAIPSASLFKPGSDVLNNSIKGDLNELARMLSSVQELVEVEIVGHTDSVKPRGNGKYSSNWALSAARSGAVAEHLVVAGLNRSIVRTSGQADLNPLFPEYSESGQMLRGNMAKNRRVNIVVKRRRGGEE